MTEYVWPVPAHVVAIGYGVRGERWQECGERHTGIDIPGPVGTWIVAPEDGRLVIPEYGERFGNAVCVVNEDGGEWFFAHCDWVLPADGKDVAKGEVIAKVGQTGEASVPHLHLEYHLVAGERSCGNMRDPMSLLATAMDPDVPFVAPSLLALLREVDECWPDRDRSHDGAIGDYEFSRAKSPHNPVGHVNGPEHGTRNAVHALDITLDPDHPDMEPLLWQATVGDERVAYVVGAEQVASRENNWSPERFDPPESYVPHFHVVLRDETPELAVAAELDETTWLLDEEITLPPPSGNVTQGDFVTRDELARALSELAQRLLDGA